MSNYINDEKKLEDFLRHQNVELKKKIKLYYKEIKFSLLGEELKYFFENNGKMLRPLLVLLSVKACGGNLKKTYNAAFSIELLHNFMLAHDDIMDVSEKRRGKDSLYKKYGLNKSIIIGDVLFALFYNNLVRDCSNHNIKEIILILTKFIVKIGEGQSLDNNFEDRKDVLLYEYKKMIYRKTAAMSEMCCCLGALLCNASDVQIKAVSNYGKYLGMAFQIQDDILDIFGDEGILGKKIGDDILQKKKTYLFIKALSKAKGKDKKYLLNTIDSNNLDNEIIKHKNLYIKLDVLKDAENEIDRYFKLAKNSIRLISDNEGKILMILFLNKIKNRNN